MEVQQRVQRVGDRTQRQRPVVLRRPGMARYGVEEGIVEQPIEVDALWRMSQPDGSGLGIAMHQYQRSAAQPTPQRVLRVPKGAYHRPPAGLVPVQRAHDPHERTGQRRVGAHRIDPLHVAECVHGRNPYLPLPR